MTLNVPMDRVCLVMMSAVGDAVHVLPVVTALKRHHPTMHLSWVLQPGPASLVGGHPDVDAVIPFDYGSGWRAYADVRRRLAGERFDLVLDLQVALKGGLVTSFTRAPVKLGFDLARARDANWLFTTHRIPPHPQQHVMDQYFEFLTHLGLPHEPVTWGLGPWSDAERAAQAAFRARVDRPIAAIVCGTSDPDKDWFPERWARVCDVLHTEYGLQPVLVGGPSVRERATAHAITTATTSCTPVNALGLGGLRGLVGILDLAALVLALDTAPMHIAVALERPVVSLMAQSDPKRTGPYGRGLDLVVNGFAEPTDPPDAVLPIRRRGRMERVSVDAVLEQVARWARQRS